MVKGFSVCFSTSALLAQALLLLAGATPASATSSSSGFACLDLIRPSILRRIATGNAIELLRKSVLVDEIKRDSIASRLVHTENLIETVISKLTDSELRQEIQKIMDRYNSGAPSVELGPVYLPGLTPETNITRVGEFYSDFADAKTASPPRTSKIRHFYGNITALVVIHRMMLDANEDTEANFEPWCEALIDTRLVLELLKRLGWDGL